MKNMKQINKLRSYIHLHALSEECSKKRHRIYREESKDKLCHIRYVKTYIQVLANLVSTEPDKNIYRKLLVGEKVYFVRRD